MKRVINLLKNHLDWLDEHKNSKLAKNIDNINSEIKVVEKAIKILEKSERQSSTKVSEQQNVKELIIPDISNRFCELGYNTDECGIHAEYVAGCLECKHFK